jgi:hypothetical protein
MRFFRTALIWLLAVSWLPATLHCAAERAGLLGSVEECCTDEPAGESNALPGSCAKAPCETLGAKLAKNTSDSLQVAAPEVWAWLTLSVILPEASGSPGLKISPDTTDSPPELVKVWQFSHRAALAPRAPGLAS